MSGYQNRGGLGPSGDRGRGRSETRGGQSQQQNRGGYGSGSRGQGDARGGRGGARGDSRGASRGDSRSGFRGGQQYQSNVGSNATAGQFAPRGGSYRGDRGSSDSPRGTSLSYRGRGGSGFGQGADRFSGEEAFFGQSANGIPSYDNSVTTTENSFSLQQVTTETAKLSLDKRQLKNTGNALPLRPAFGTQGKAVTLWANYFSVTHNGLQALHKYIVEVTRVIQGNTDPEREKVFGRSREEIIRSVLEEVSRGIPYATEYKSQVISLKPLNVPNGFVEKNYAEPGRDSFLYRVTFDGPTILSTNGLVEFLSQQNVTVSDDNSYSRFEDLIGALGVILAHSARTDRAVASVGRGSHFPLNLESQREAIGNPRVLQIIRGYFQSVRAATDRILLNVNVTHGIFRPAGNLQTLLERFGLHPRTLATVMTLLNRARIKCRMYSDMNGKYTEVEKTITGFAQRTPNDGQPRKFKVFKDYGGPGDVQFLLEVQRNSSQTPPPGLQWNQFVSVKDYYLKRYGQKLIDHLPVINTGTTTKPSFYPAEFCEIIPGQPSRSRLLADQAQDMIRFACRSPFANATSISTVGRQVLRLDSNPVLKNFGLTVNPRLITVPGRELTAPAIKYNDGKQVTPREGSWNMNNVEVITPGPQKKKWTWIHITRYQLPDEFDNNKAKRITAECMRFMIKNMKVNLHPDALHPDAMKVVIQGNHLDDALTPLREQLQKAKDSNMLPDIALVVLPDQESAVYNAVKYLADIEFGFHTVCIVKKTLLKSDHRPESNKPYNLSTFSNLALKFNLKTGGVNHSLQSTAALGRINSGTVMVVGYDVIHPTNLPTDGGDLPSQVGLVASIDGHLGQWPCTYWNQRGKTEMLDDKLVQAFVSRLDLWQKHNRQRLPQEILIFRDGVSEGQFKQVLDNELPKIRKAIDLKYKDMQKPRISIIVSVKRHHTRFYPTTTDHMGRSRNITNGTVVDRGVTQAKYWEFFLTSHSAIQGTAKPARYVVLLDEIFRDSVGLRAADILEQLVHHMSYLFGRATKAVSICPPAYYADIVCTRARVHMAALFDAPANALTAQQRAVIVNRQVHANLRDSMYYI